MKRFSNILYVGTDREIAPGPLERAAALAENHQAELTVMAVAELPRLGRLSGVLPPGEFESRFRRLQQERLEAAVAPIAGRVRVSTTVRIGTPFIEVVRDVLRSGRDLVIKPAGSGGVDDFLFGSFDQHLLRKCPCPVWIVAPGDGPACRRVLAAVDLEPWQAAESGSALNRRILELASAIALAEFAALHVAYAWSSLSDSVVRVFSSELTSEQVEANRRREQQDHHDALQRLGHELRGWIGAEAHDLLAPRLHLLNGAARDEIPRCVQDLGADLLVLGTVCRTGVAGFIIGNTAEYIIDRTSVSVLAVKPDGFVTPVAPDRPQGRGAAREP